MVSNARSGATYDIVIVEPSPPDVAALACLATRAVLSTPCLMLRAVLANEGFPACARGSTGEALTLDESRSRPVRAACVKPLDCLDLGDIPAAF